MGAACYTLVLLFVFRLHTVQEGSTSDILEYTSDVLCTIDMYLGTSRIYPSTLRGPYTHFSDIPEYHSRALCTTIIIKELYITLTLPFLFQKLSSLIFLSVHFVSFLIILFISLSIYLFLFPFYLLF